MIGVEELTAKPQGQVVLCATADAYARLLADLPEKFALLQREAGDGQGDFVGLSERRVVAVNLEQDLLQMIFAAMPAEIKRIDAPLPAKWETTALAWCAANARIWPDKASTESTQGSSDAATPGPESPGSSSPAVDTDESAAQEPGGASTGAAISSVLHPAASDPIEPAQPALATEPSQEDSEQAGADPITDPDDYRLVPSIINDTAFLIRWQALTFERREALGEAPAERAIRLQMQDMASETHVARAIAASQDAETDPLGDDPDLDVPMGHPALDAPPAPDSEPPNGYDSQEPSRIWVKPLDDGGWAAPIDILATARRKRIDPYEICPGWMADYASDCARPIGGDIAIILAAIPAALSGIIDDQYLAQPYKYNTKWLEHCTLWAAVIGGTSTFKNPMMESVMEPLTDLNQEATKEGAAILKKWLMAKEIYAIERGDYQRKVAKGESAKEPEEPGEAQGLSYFLCHDFNVEGMRRHLQAVSKGLYYNEEGGALFGTLGRYSNSKAAEGGDRAHLLGLYSARERTILRGTGNITVPNWSASLLIGTTPSSLHQSVGGAVNALNADGLLQRLLIACPIDAVAERHDVAPNEEMHAVFLRVIRNLKQNRAIGRTVLPFDNEAVEIFQEFEARLDAAASSDLYSEAMRGHMLKFRGVVPRLALFFTLAEHARIGTHAITGDKIPAESVSMAIAYCERFQWAQLSHFWTVIMGATNKASVYVKWIAEHLIVNDYQTITLAKLNRVYRAWCELDYKVRAQTMYALMDYGWIRQSPRAKLDRGIPTIWEVNPLIRDQYEGTAIQDNVKTARAARRAHLQELRGLQ